MFYVVSAFRTAGPSPSVPSIGSDLDATTLLLALAIIVFAVALAQLVVIIVKGIQDARREALLSARTRRRRKPAPEPDVEEDLDA